MVLSSLAQLGYCELNSAAPLHCVGSPPLRYTSRKSCGSGERSATSLSSSPVKSARGHACVSPFASSMCSQVRFSVHPSPRPGISQHSPTKVPTITKWNSNVRCQWPLEQPNIPIRVSAGDRVEAASCRLSSPSRVAGGGIVSFTPRRLTSTAGVTTRNVEEMTSAGINDVELIKKVETLELELDVHAGNEGKLLAVNEQLRKRFVIVVDQHTSINLIVAITQYAIGDEHTCTDLQQCGLLQKD
uniref:Uncharacterized protein n=1 Tax=Physcomitrium patens TaxID=3218 RepID=A0A2K1K381_PHYPA|nr:hypothetical protein PHYPA_012703 [Physcomitrium patens]